MVRQHEILHVDTVDAKNPAAPECVHIHIYIL